MGFTEKDVCSLDVKLLLTQIEKVRTDINKLYENSALTDDDVLHKSRILDELLNIYDKIVKW